MPDNTDIRVALIVALASNRVIGRDNQLPWHLPNDLRYFKATTMGKPIIMGRKTFESIGKPLPGRANIVVTANPDFSAPGTIVVHSGSAAIATARQIASKDQVAEVVVIGGAKLYRELLPQVTRLYLTQVHADIPGDAFFPELDLSQWLQVSCEQFTAGESNPWDYSFVVFEKK